jgi:hypothetical protein
VFSKPLAPIVGFEFPKEREERATKSTVSHPAIVAGRAPRPTAAAARPGVR